jgi:hypothetical protein
VKAVQVKAVQLKAVPGKIATDDDASVHGCLRLLSWSRAFRCALKRVSGLQRRLRSVILRS